jgi:O-antigen ligase
MHRFAGLADTHNYYMKVVVEQGIIGIGILFLVLWRFFRMGWALYKRSEDILFNAMGLGAAATTICIFIVNIFGDRWTFVEINGMVWVMFGLIASAHTLLEAPVSNLSQNRLNSQQGTIYNPHNGRLRP